MAKLRYLPYDKSIKAKVKRNKALTVSVTLNVVLAAAIVYFYLT